MASSEWFLTTTQADDSLLPSRHAYDTLNLWGGSRAADKFFQLGQLLIQCGYSDTRSQHLIAASVALLPRLVGLLSPLQKIRQVDSSCHHRVDESDNRALKTDHYRNHANNAMCGGKMTFPQITKKH